MTDSCDGRFATPSVQGWARLEAFMVAWLVRWLGGVRPELVAGRQESPVWPVATSPLVVFHEVAPTLAPEHRREALRYVLAAIAWRRGRSGAWLAKLFAGRAKDWSPRCSQARRWVYVKLYVYSKSRTGDVRLPLSCGHSPRPVACADPPFVHRMSTRSLQSLQLPL